jgi:hypothetical protein
MTMRVFGLTIGQKISPGSISGGAAGDWRAKVMSINEVPA